MEALNSISQLKVGEHIHSWDDYFGHFNTARIIAIEATDEDYDNKVITTLYVEWNNGNLARIDADQLVDEDDVFIGEKDDKMELEYKLHFLEEEIESVKRRLKFYK